MAVSLPTDCKKFRAAVRPMSVFFFVTGMLAAWGLIFILHGLGFSPDRHAFAMAVAIGMPLTCISSAIISIGGAWIISVCFPDAVSADGLYGHSFWGRRRFVCWQDISKAHKFQLAYLPLLRVYGADGKVSWLALFPAKKKEFLEEIRKFAPSDSPVLPFAQ